jgi:2-polyprenyl-3-methyl-5-hydroxy-6-metoxy-1,4-benzoquinol methylase
MAIRLPVREHISATNDEDPLQYYYLPLTRHVYTRRLQLVCDLLEDGPFENLLEIGYGSGILLPELSQRCRRLVAVDIHRQFDQVYAMLEAEGVVASLHYGDVRSLPFQDGEFDAVVCISVLEHLVDLDAAVSEISRILRPGGVAVTGFPVRNSITNAFYRLVGHDPIKIHPSSHRDILDAIHSGLQPDRSVIFPSFLPVDFSLYVVCRSHTASRRPQHTTANSIC